MSEEQGSESAVSRSQFIKEEKVAEEKEAPKKVSRREFVKGAAAVASVGALASCAPAATPGPGETAAPAPTCPPAGECPPAATPWIPAKWDYETDVVVVGFGYAGTCAAIEAFDNGASVIVLEKAPKEHWGGNSGAKMGGSWSIGDTVEANIEYLTSQAWGTVPDAEVIRALSESEHELPAWFESLGATIAWKESAPTYSTIPGAEAWKGTREHNSFAPVVPVEAAGIPGECMEWLASLVLAREIPVMTDTPAKELIQDPFTKEILGVKALEGVTSLGPPTYGHTGGKEIYIKAKKGVILACGGYENNEEMIKNFMADMPHSAFVTFYGTPYNTGDGVTMAQKVSAKLWHMQKKEMHALSCAPATREFGVGMYMLVFGSYIDERGPGIIVNRDGQRFYNEYHMHGHSDQQRVFDGFEHKLTPADDYDYGDYRHVPMYWIFDDTTIKSGKFGHSDRWINTRGIYTWSDDNMAEVEKGWIIKADTIEELGNKIEIKDWFGRVVGMDAAALAETVTKYNQYAAAGKDEDFGRRPETLQPIVTPPFYAMDIIQTQTNTDGGPEHDQYQQCMDLDGNTIRRLYTAGELGSQYGFLYNGGGNIPEAGANGRVAGKHAAGLEPWDA